MTGANFLEALAAHLAWIEGDGYGLNAQIAILFCIRNRVAAGYEDGDLSKILEVLYADGKGLLFNDKTGIFIPDPRNPEFQQLLGYVEGIFDNSFQDKLTNGALYWGIEKPPEAKIRVAQIGTLLFWR
jgi:hypothetical protein